MVDWEVGVCRVKTRSRSVSLAAVLRSSPGTPQLPNLSAGYGRVSLVAYNLLLKQYCNSNCHEKKKGKSFDLSFFQYVHIYFDHAYNPKHFRRDDPSAAYSAGYAFSCSRIIALTATAWLPTWHFMVSVTFCLFFKVRPSTIALCSCIRVG